MPNVNALPVEVPFPCHEPSALFAELPSQDCITEIRKHLVGIFQTDCFQRRRTFKDTHILFDLSGCLYHRSKLSVYFRSCDICRSKPDDAVSVNRAERFLFPSDVDQTVFQQICIQIFAQELLFYLSQKSFFLWCEFFVHIVPPISVPFLSAKKALDLVCENQQSSAHNFVKDFSPIF